MGPIAEPIGELINRLLTQPKIMRREAMFNLDSVSKLIIRKSLLTRKAFKEREEHRGIPICR